MKEIKKDDIIEFLEKLPKKKVEGKTFEEWLMYENRPLWWYVRIPFLMSHCPFKSLHFDSLIKLINNNESVKTYTIKQRFFLFFFNKIFFLNEFFRWVVSIFSNDNFHPKIGKKNVMFFAHTNALFKKGKYYEIDRVENLRTLIDAKNNMSSYVSSIEPPSQNTFFRLLKMPNLVYKHITFRMLFGAFFKTMVLCRRKHHFLRKANFKTEKERLIFKSLNPLFSFYISWERIFLIVLYYNLYSRIITKKKINFILFYSTGDTVSRCAIAATEKKNVFAGTILHGLGVSYIKPELPKNFLYFVPGQIYKQILSDSGVLENNIYSTGALFLSDIIDFMNKKHEESKKILFITSSYVKTGFISENDYASIIKSTFLAFKKCKDYNFIHKPHPQEDNLHIYKNAMKELKTTNISFDKTSKTKKDLYKRINECDFVVSLGSTVDIEALILQKPVLFLDFIPQDDGGYFPHYKYPDAFITVKNTRQTYSALQSIISGDKGLSAISSKFVNDHFSFLDREVTDRILKVIQRHLK